MIKQLKPHAETSLAIERLKAVYETKDAKTVFVKAYQECVGGLAENALCDFRLYLGGETASLPAYIERACRDHGVWPCQIRNRAKPVS